MNSLTYNQRLEILRYFEECICNYGVGGYESTLPANENGDLFFEFSDSFYILAEDYDDLLRSLYNQVLYYVYESLPF